MAQCSDPLPALSDFAVRDALAAAFKEDLGDAGDLTSLAVIPGGAHARVELVARETGCIAGLGLAGQAFQFLGPEVEFNKQCDDGETVKAGRKLAEISGPARSILSAERIALNFLGHMSGIASATQSFVAVIEGTKANICCTRKTTPGLRAFEKYAVRAGGGVNHRFGLYDGILIKDNHIAIAGGIKPALEAARAHGGHMVKIEIEVDTLAQLDEALTIGVDAILLDNMSTQDLTEAVKRIDGQALAEASGGVTIDTVRAIAETGVNLISVGWLTHSAPCLDVALDYI